MKKLLITLSCSIFMISAFADNSTSNNVNNFISTSSTKSTNIQLKTFINNYNNLAKKDKLTQLLMIKNPKPDASSNDKQNVYEIYLTDSEEIGTSLYLNTDKKTSKITKVYNFMNVKKVSNQDKESIYTTMMILYGLTLGGLGNTPNEAGNILNELFKGLNTKSAQRDMSSNLTYKGIKYNLIAHIYDAGISYTLEVK